LKKETKLLRQGGDNLPEHKAHHIHCRHVQWIPTCSTKL